MHRGYVKLWRKTLESKAWRNPNTWRLFTYCILKASKEEFVANLGRQKIPLEPGQFIFGRKVASEETGLSEQQIRTAILALKSTSKITIKTTNKFSVITVVNWHTYQEEATPTNHQNNQVPNHIQESIIYNSRTNFQIPLKDKSYFTISDELVTELKILFPDVNFEQELKKMSAWCLGNPKKRKTKAGARRFITAWLSRAQDKINKTKPQYVECDF